MFLKKFTVFVYTTRLINKIVSSFMVSYSTKYFKTLFFLNKTVLYLKNLTIGFSLFGRNVHAHAHTW